MRNRNLAIVSTLAIGLAACALTPAQIATDIGLLSSGLQAVVAALSGTPNIPPATIATAQTALAEITSAAGVAASDPTKVTTTVAEQVAADVSTIAEIAAGVPALAPYAKDLNAAIALVPVIEMEVQQAQAVPATPTTTAARAALMGAAHR